MQKRQKVLSCVCRNLAR